MPKKILLLLTGLWLAVAIPLCAAVYLYFRTRITSQEDHKQADQEKVLTQVFERSARFGDLVNAKTDLETLGRAFRLRRVFICKDGFDVIGGLTSVPCGAVSRSYAVQLFEQKLQLQFDWESAATIYDPIILKAVGVTGIISLILFSVITWLIYNFLLLKIRTLSTRISQADTEAGLSPEDYEIPEFQPILCAFAGFQSRIRANNEQIAHLRTSEALAELAKQVAHDIRSPLSALKIFAARVSLGPELAQLVSGAVDRIEGIASDLLNFEPSPEGDQFALSFFESLVDLKAAEYMGSAKIHLEAAFDAPVLLPLSGHKLFRCLSNVLNNSVEAFGKDSGNIWINVVPFASHLEISVRDSGKGMPQEIARKLGTGQISYGKPQGFGLGLSYVFSALQTVGGTVSVESAENQGTTVRLAIPAVI